jgi:hypothetical protein
MSKFAMYPQSFTNTNGTVDPKVSILFIDCYLTADVVFIELSGKLKELCQIFAGVEYVEIRYVSPTLHQ